MVYLGTGERIVTGRSMDWKSEIGTNLWALPRGVTRDGQAGPDSATWTAKYGSVIATAYECATTDGVNDAGLGVNLLWLAESQYPPNTGDRPAMALSLWAQYVLDNFATVAEAVGALTATPLRVVTAQVPGQDLIATVHLAISDASGDSAIIEYIDGEQVIHHAREYQVMTNSPIFAKQLAITEYWEEIGGAVMLPGTNRAADRFVRASFYINAVPKTADPVLAVAAVFSVVRNASVPYGISTPDQPNISTTRWRTVIDHTSLRYCFESALSPNTFWVELRNMDLSEGAAAMRLSLGEGEKTVYAGDASAHFEEAEPFAFMAAT